MVAIVVLASVGLGCSGSSTAVDEARSRWSAAKAGCATYSYRRVFQSVFGSAWSSAVEITGDVATRRHYIYTERGAKLSEWDEQGAEVGTHTDTTAFAAETVEGLLSECETILAADPATYTVMSTFDDRGIPQVCIKIIKGAADDVASGIWIDRFDCAPLDAAGAVVERPL